MSTLETQYREYLRNSQDGFCSFEEWKEIHGNQIKQALIDMMKSDEELGLYDDMEINRIEVVCKDCSDSLEDCTCIVNTINFPKQETNLSKHLDSYPEYPGPRRSAIVSKQETPEEAAERIIIEYVGNEMSRDDKRLYAMLKAVTDKLISWQAERMYSEEDMRNAFTQGFNARYKMLDGIESREKFLEQFKNK
jgi:hypothetical protein